MESHSELGPRDLTPDLSESARGRWTTAFLVVGSALLGATAVAFWNRRTIAHLRASLPTEAEHGPLPGSAAATRNDEEIF